MSVSIAATSTDAASTATTYVRTRGCAMSSTALICDEDARQEHVNAPDLGDDQLCARAS